MRPSAALIKRELLIPSRSRGQFALLLLILFIGVWLVAGAWPGSPVVWSYLPIAAVQILFSLSVLLIIGVAIIVPGIAANAILGERLTGNWDGMALTLIRPAGLVGAKLVAVIARYLVMVAALGPLFACVVFLVGFDWRQVAAIMALIVATTATLASVGLGCSATFRSMTWAIIASYGMMLMLMGLPIVILGTIAAINGGGAVGNFVEVNAWSFSPLAVMLSFIAGGIPFSHFWNHMGYQGIYFAVGLALTWRGVRRAQEPRTEGRSAPQPIAEDERTDAGSRLIPDRANAMYVRETRWGGAMNTRRLALAAPAAFVVFLMISAAIISLDATPPGYLNLAATIFIHGAILCCVMPALFANSFTKERELKNLDMLRATLLSPRQVVWGKFRAAITFFVVMWAMSFLGNTVTLASVVDLPPRPTWTWLDDLPAPILFFMGHATILFAGLFALAITLCVSIVARRTAGAIVISQVMVFMVMAGFAMLALFLVASSGVEPSVEFGFVLLFTSPALWHFSWLIDDVKHELEDYVQLSLIHDSITIILVCVLFLLAVKLYESREMREP